ncbi:helix-turn-helix domain-containing protein [Nonomuraea sp. GTA35]|uniref:helix-turn-helix domain-containing protein n=1 Tax=Nonomuraea sp. GTA35 TaxID=1676746 RepID=UPI0035BF653C
MEPFGEALRRLRLRAGLSVREVARRATCGKSYVSDLEHGRRRGPSMPVAQALDKAVGAGGELVALASVVANLTNGADAVEGDGDEVRRREFVGLTGAALFDAVLSPSDDSARAGGAIEALAEILVDHAPSSGGPMDLPSLVTAVRAAKRNYQACRYSHPSPAGLSVYGSLLLRGAIAATHSGERHTITEFLDEAAEAGARLGHEGNHMWTAFGPNNVLCHRVNIAIRLGDAGAAIEYARQVEIDKLQANERRAGLLLDTSRAFLMRGQHEKALHILRAVGDLAPQEIAGRAAPLRLVRDISATAPPTLRREAREYAASFGVDA